MVASEVWKMAAKMFFLANSDKEKEQKRWLAQWEMKILWIFAANQQSRSKNHRLQFSGLLPNWFDPFSELGDLFDHEHHLRCSSVAGCNFLITAYRSYAMSASCCWHLSSTNNWTPLQIAVVVKWSKEWFHDKKVQGLSPPTSKLFYENLPT